MTQWPQDTAPVTIIIGGAPIAVGNPIPISGSISATNPSVSATGAAVPASATYLGASDGTNLQGLLVQNNVNPNLRVALFNGATGLTGAKAPAASLAMTLDTSVEVATGTAAPANALQVGGSDGTNLQALQVDASKNLKTTPAYGATAASTNQGSIDGGTQRVAQGGASTGTKSNVASSASSVTILAANSSRKGNMIYNDSTQILYLDMTGGTASTSSYSNQVASQGLFEPPPPSIYNGAITGIWASANGNARVTEFT